MLKEIKHKIVSNKDNKVLVQNFAYLSLLQVASYVFPIITMPYLARVIGVDGFGKIAFASAVMVWIQTIADWGFNFTATRDVAQNRENAQKVSEIFSNVLWARCILSLVSLIFLLLLIAFVPAFRENSGILLVSFLMIPGHILFPDWFFQAMERMRYITILNLISKIIFTIAIFVFINEKSDYILQPLLVSLGYVVSGIIALYYILVKWKIQLKFPKISKIYQTIRNSTDVFLNNLMPNLYNSFSIVLLGFLGGSVANGKLDAGSKITNACIGFIGVATRTFFPFLSRKKKKHSTYAKYSIVISSIITICIFICAPIINNLIFTSEFSGTEIIIRITVFSIFFITLSDIYGKNFLIINGYEKKLRKLTTKVSIIGLFVGIWLIYFFDYIGAAITITMTRGLLGVGSYIEATKVKKDTNEKNL